MATKWKDLEHKSSPERRAQIDREASTKLDRMGYGALRNARFLTQLELAERLGMSQGSLSAIENRTDLHLSTLAKYVRALGGRTRDARRVSRSHVPPGAIAASRA